MRTARAWRGVVRAVALCALAAYASACAAADATAPTTPTTPSQPGAPARMDASAAEVGLNAVGASEQVSVTVRDAQGRVIPQASVLWTSTDITVADVAGNGLNAVITARAPGRTVIRAHLGVFVQDIVVTVSGARAVTLAPAVATVRVGDKLTLVPTLDGDPSLRADLRWQSDNITVATVSATGEVSGIAPGSTLVRVSLMGDPRVTATAQVTVSTARTVTITPTSPSTYVGDRVQLAATVDVDSGQSAAVTWSSEQPAIATVTAAGEVIGVSTGTVNVRATSVADPRASAIVSVTVLPARTVTVTPAVVQLAAGETRFLNASVAVEPGLSRDVTWRSSDLGVAMVSSGGLVTGVGQGTATITAISIADTTRRGTAVVTVTAGVRDVDLQPSALTMFMGDVRTLVATVDADVGASRVVLWRTSNPTIATVDAAGTVTAVNAGSAIITAMAAGDTTRRATALVTVRTAIAVSVTPTGALLDVGQTRAFTATVRADVGVSTAVTWRSADPAIATINASGVVTGVSAGTTQIIAVSVADTTRSGSASVTIVPVVQSVGVSPSAAAIAPSEQLQLSAVVSGDPGVSQAVIWRSADNAIASVSLAGVVTGVANGTTTITAIAANDTLKRASASITVRPAPQAPVVSVSPTQLQLDPAQTRQLTATVQANPGVSTAVTWQSGDPSVVTVSGTGLVTAVAAGSTTITVTSVADPTRRAFVAVVVNGPVAQVNAVTVTPTSASVVVGNTVQLSATVTVQGTLPTTVTWRSSNPSVASVNVNGVVSGMATGSATITALATADTTKKATAALTITSAPPPPPPPVSRLAVSWTASRLNGPLIEDVVSIAAIDANTAFAINSNGDVFRFSAGSWSMSAAGASWNTQFRAVHAASNTMAIAVGTNGVIARWNGTNWTSMGSGTTRTLNGVWVESTNTAFAVGDNGTALRFDGSTWSSGATGSTAVLDAVWSAGGVATAVGEDGEILRFASGSWSRQVSGTAGTLTGIAGTSANDLVAVGRGGIILRGNGTTWTRIGAGVVTADIYAVAGGASTGGIMYLATDVGLLQLSGTAVSTVNTPYAPALFSAGLDNSGSAWVGGQRGSVLRGAGASWSTNSLAPDLIDVWSTSATNAFIVGEFGFIYRWNGSTWTRQTAPTTATLNAVWAAGPNEAFAGGDNGTMLRWNGTTWSTVAFPGSGHVYGLWGSAANNVWAVTSAGTIARWNGSSWSVVSNTGTPLWSVHGSSANDVVAAGASGAVWRFNGSAWSTANINTTGTLAGVFAAGANDYYAIGANDAGNTGLAFFASGVSWSSINVGSSRVLTSVWGPSDTDLYATGEQGTILRYNGTSWSAMASGTGDLLWSVSGAPDGTGGGFAVGYNSRIVSAVAGAGGIGTVSASRAASVSARVTRGDALGLDPRPGARVVRGALPSGPARKLRRTR
ncbi:MAG: Ig-like domain-containing protein [Gemmatimonadetes bacterium]|nr:Ig-like domain-containing protein [Gemmatimonadota bacterium]